MKQEIILWISSHIQALQNPLVQFLEQNSRQTAFGLYMLGCMLFGAVLYKFVSTAYRNWRMQQRFKRGHAAERNAIRFLQKNGYRIIGAQLRETIVMHINGEPQERIVRADYLVRKGWKTYVVEVKSGQQGDARLTNVRRQMLEYQLVYRPDGMLLLDMEHRALQKVRFTYTSLRKHQWVRYGLVCLTAGVLAWAYMHFI